MVAVGPGRLSWFFLRGGLAWSMLLAGPPDLVNVERLGQCIGGGLGKHHLRRYYRNRAPPRRGEDWLLWVRLEVWESESALANHVREAAANHNELCIFSAQDLGVFVFSTLFFFLKVTAGILLPFLTHNDDLRRATVELRQPAIYCAAIDVGHG